MPGDSKQQAVEQLKKRVNKLPLNITPEELERKFDRWEKDYGNIIDKERYKPGIKTLMNIFHCIQKLFSDKETTFKTRMFVNHIEKQTHVEQTTHTISMRR
ncbi:hypothetical protein [Rickettsiella massiliensis]|uniref:hypothetical protein n=1 Tax=Rickettsiella massiliensis TaxID=676517 RepID=UPI00029B1C6B|nr:hypothetical protein [Rickettsiella massiliensis]